MTRAGEKLVTVVLAGVCGALFVLALAMQFGLGRGYHWQAAASDAGDVAAGAIDKDGFVMPPESQFAAIAQRPLFNDDRKPQEETVEGPAEPPPSPLNISLTGTLLAGKPEVRIAMVRDNGKAQTIALKEGMPLPGDQGGWTLTQVKKRSAIFKSVGGDEVEVELAVASASQKPGPAPKPGAAGAPAKPQPNQPTTTPVAAQSEELQHRIEERRRQMREAAERMKAQHQGEPGQPPQEPQQQ